MTKSGISLFLAIVFTQTLVAQDPPFLKYLDHPWVDSIVATLDTREQIAQSIWMAAWSNRDARHTYEISKLIEDHKIGGLIFFQGSGSKEAELINLYQDLSEVPLLLAMDAEWGPGMRLDNITDFPYQMTLGAIQDDSLLYLMGREVAAQMKRLGLHQNLAPVADINNNPNNPVINFRSFGENKAKVSSKTGMYCLGMQDAGIAATAKHFPGHGDTDTDSHKALPQLNHSRLRFDTLELVPFKNLINAGISSVMSAHLNIPAYDTATNLPSTLSKEIMTGLLRNKLGFKGLVITDAMNMRGVTDYYEDGIADALAYAAGNDVLEYVNDPGKSIDVIMSFLQEGKISEEDIEMKCRRVLALKFWCGLNDIKNIETENIEDEVNSETSRALIYDLYASSLTLLKNQESILPLKNLESNRIACLTINGEKESGFAKMCSNYTRTVNYNWKTGDNTGSLVDELQPYDIVLVIINDTDQRPYRDFGITHELNSLLEVLCDQNNTVVVYPGNPYAIDMLKGLENAKALILAYQDNSFTSELSAQLIFGGLGAHGKLPVTINADYPEGFGLITPGNIRLRYAFPENAGVSSKELNHRIDSIVNAALEAEAFPGCEIIAARKGTVIFHKAYGHHTYLKRNKIREGDIFDLASVTKVSAATTGLMALDNLDLFSPDEELGNYSRFFRGSDKEHLGMREILAHQAGLKPWIPYWQNTVNNKGEFRANTFKPYQKKKYSIRVSDNLYLKSNYKKKIFREIKKSPLGEKKYLYSGLMFYVFPTIITERSGMDFEYFLKSKVYHRIGAFDIGFNPYTTYPLEIVVPTENDDFFRMSQLHGFVHDEGAAMMGGISGNAGLFASANDLLKLFEMFRRYGAYGGEQLLDEEIVRSYTSYQFPENDNRRGLGFDKPLVDENDGTENDYPCPSASPSSFGHSGYTGTFAWADPEKEITYIFLSNRVYPTRDNNKISDMNIRTEILQSIYDSIID
ncbi:MAG: glycoside hydrolase family 3 N-terminal domain-containing protein [Marinilabiliaceae bacterium]|jgi:beta-glucosidase-like glycosyl hydrolase/CubicO group peptidase (beta-lactamase class C family)|nr:glycoside hydrolase family 3 N-terminal domain-containing protein [Marinilabiliaceae bacterium]